MEAQIKKFGEKYDLILDGFRIQQYCGEWHRGYVSQDCRNLPKLDHEGVFIYGIRHSDADDCRPISLEKSVLVNRYGWFITTENLDWLFKEKDMLEISDWDYTED